MKSFGDLISDLGWPVSYFADRVGVSRQSIYKYMNGMVNPLNVPYANITNMASYLNVSPDEVYNSICESFESKRIYCETLGKWMLPEEIIEKVR